MHVRESSVNTEGLDKKGDMNDRETTAGAGPLGFLAAVAGAVTLNAVIL